MTGQRPRLEATRYSDGSVSFPGHPVGPNGSEPVDTIDLTEKTGTIVTWTSNTATPPGVRSPNHLGIIEFDIGDGQSVRVIGQLTTNNVSIGDTVTPVYVDSLRDPSEIIRKEAAQRWDGYRFEPTSN